MIDADRERRSTRPMMWGGFRMLYLGVSAVRDSLLRVLTGYREEGGAPTEVATKRTLGHEAACLRFSTLPTGPPPTHRSRAA